MNSLCFGDVTVKLNEVERVFWEFQNWKRVIVVEYKDGNQKYLLQSQGPIAELATQLDNLVHCSFRTSEHIKEMVDALTAAKH